MRLEMSGELTQKDKKLLVMLGVIITAVCFGFLLIKPLNSWYQEEKIILAEQQVRKEVNEKKDRLYGNLEEYTEALKTNIVKDAKGFYPFMTSEEIDKLLTDLVLSYGLEARDLTIIMAPDGAQVKPYERSEKGELYKALGNEAKPVSNQAEMVFDVDASSGQSEFTPAGSESEAAGAAETAEPEETSLDQGLYQADVTMKVQGSDRNLKRLIDSLVNDHNEIRVTAFAFADSYNLITDLTQEADGSDRVLSISLEIYMYRTQEEMQKLADDKEGAAP